jgi:hypothetical protein
MSHDIATAGAGRRISFPDFKLTLMAKVCVHSGGATVVS